MRSRSLCQPAPMKDEYWSFCPQVVFQTNLHFSQYNFVLNLFQTFILKDIIPDVYEKNQRLAYYITVGVFSCKLIGCMLCAILARIPVFVCNLIGVSTNSFQNTVTTQLTGQSAPCHILLNLLVLNQFSSFTRDFPTFLLCRLESLFRYHRWNKYRRACLS